MKEIDIEIHPLGRGSRVTVDGELLPVTRAVITMDVNDVTRVELTCVKRGGKPFVFKGHLVPDPPEAGK